MSGVASFVSALTVAMAGDAPTPEEVTMKKALDGIFAVAYCGEVRFYFHDGRPTRIVVPHTPHAWKVVKGD